MKRSHSSPWRTPRKSPAKEGPRKGPNEIPKSALVKQETVQKTEEEPGKRGSQEGGANEIPKSALVKQETVQKTDKGITAKLKKYEQHTVGKVNSYTQKEGNLKSYEIDNTDICKYAGNAGKKNIQKEKLINSLEDKSEKVMLKILKKRKLKKEKKNVKMQKVFKYTMEENQILL